MLLDMVLALAIILMVAAIAWPAMPTGGNRALLSAAAMSVAAELRADRLAAAREGRPAATVIDLSERSVTGASGRRVTFARGVEVAIKAGKSCEDGSARYRIEFQADGSSCGAEIRLLAGGRQFTVRVDWLTGWVDVRGPDNA